MAKRTVMIVGGGILQVPAVRIAREMGLRTVVTDYNPNAPAFALADDAIVMSTKDIEGSVRVAKTYRGRIHGVLTVGTDASMTVAAVAHALDLPGIHFEAAEAATNKIKMRRTLRAAGVPVPNFRGVWDLNEAREAAAEIGLPAVLKPADNMGARGVIKVDAPGQVEPAFRHAKSHSTSGEVIVEAYMEGPELSIDCLVHGGEILCWGVADRHIGYPPYFIEYGHTLPSDLPEDVQAAARATMERAVRALGITLGAAKGDVKITRDGPMIGECAARLSGGWMSSHTYVLATGYSMIRGAIEIALGERPRIPALKSRVAMERALIPPPGRVVSIAGVEEARALPGVAEVILHVAEGDEVATPTSNLDKAGHVIVSADDREACRVVMDRALERVRVETARDGTLTMPEVFHRARGKFGAACRVCRVCDGVVCAGWVPGVGGIGTGRSFAANLESLARWRIRTNVIHDVAKPRLETAFLGLRLALPVLTAPITGAVTNMGGATTEEAFQAACVEGARRVGAIGCVGDGATPEKYRIGLEAIKRIGGWGIPFFKPRADRHEVLKRVAAAAAAGAVAMGMDVDGAAFVTMRRKKQAVAPKSVADLKELVEAAGGIPFLVKGVMSARDAAAAVEAGAAAIVVSNHGGRVADHMPGGAEVLPEIAHAVAGAVPLVLDGGIRSGEDVFKALALGASAVMIGRPVMIAAVGAGAEGVALYLETIRDELERVLVLTGVEDTASVPAEAILPAEPRPIA